MNPEQIALASQRALAQVYGGIDNVPITLEDMTFDNYRSLISNGNNWPHFEAIFGGVRTRTSAKLKEIGDLRNDLFHFKREILVQDHLTLALRPRSPSETKSNRLKRVAGVRTSREAGIAVAFTATSGSFREGRAFL